MIHWRTNEQTSISKCSPTYRDLWSFDKPVFRQTIALIVLDWRTVRMPIVCFHLEWCWDRMDHYRMHHLMCPNYMSNSEWPMLLRTMKLTSKFSKIFIKQTTKLIEFKNRKKWTEYLQHNFAIEMTQTLAHNAHETIGKRHKNIWIWSSA